jgi:hypothetical protein
LLQPGWHDPAADKASVLNSARVQWVTRAEYLFVGHGATQRHLPAQPFLHTKRGCPVSAKEGCPLPREFVYFTHIPEYNAHFNLQLRTKYLLHFIFPHV